MGAAGGHLWRHHHHYDTARCWLQAAAAAGRCVRWGLSCWFVPVAVTVAVCRFYFNIALDVIFWLDLIGNIFTGLRTDDDELLTSVSQIWASYGSFPGGNFWVDLLSVFPMDYIALSGHNPYASDFPATNTVVVYRLLSLYRIFRFSRFRRYFAHFEKNIRVSWAALQAIRNIFMIIIFVHWMACAYHLQADLHGFTATTWVAINGLIGAPEINRYSYAMLSGFSLLTTNAYGNYGTGAPSLISELWIFIATMLIGIAGWSATTGSFAALIRNLDPNGQAYVQRQDELNAYLKERNLPPQLRSSVRFYYTHRFNTNKIFDEEAIIASMSPAIQREIMGHVARSVLQSVPLFREASKGFLNMVLPLLRNEFVAKEEIVLIENEPPSQLYFIGSGTVVLYRETSGISKFHAGSYFGDVAVHFGIPQPLTAFTKRDCEFYVADGDAFKAILEGFEDVKASFIQQVEQRVVQLGISDCLPSNSKPSVPQQHSASVDTLHGLEALHRELEVKSPSRRVTSDVAGERKADDANGQSASELLALAEAAEEEEEEEEVYAPE